MTLLSFDQDWIPTVQQGIEFILQHFDVVGQSRFPRKISVNSVYGIIVTDKEQVLYECIKGNRLDCRINAYPIVSDYDLNAGLLAPDVLFSDIDRNIFNTEREFISAVNITWAKIRNELKTNPAVVWSGNRVHFYTLIDTRPLNIYKDLTLVCAEPSRDFLRWAENYFTSGYCDGNHSSTGSFKAYYLRIPGTLNSKNNKQVRVLSTFSGIGRLNSEILRKFKLDCVEIRRQQIVERSKHNNKAEYYSGEIAWIENLYLTAIEENRYFCIWRIFGPYFRKIQGLSLYETEIKVKGWLDRCNEIKPVENMKGKLSRGLKNTEKYAPISLDRLRLENLRNNGAYSNILKVVGNK